MERTTSPKPLDEMLKYAGDSGVAHRVREGRKG